MLPDLHAALRTYPGELPLVAGHDIRRGMELLAASGEREFLSAAEVDLLHASAERLAPFLAAPGGDVRPLHGDAHPGNLVATRAGLVWIDFEDVCRGPMEWDLASMMDAGAEVRHLDPDPELLARCRQLRALQVALALTTFYDDFGDTEGWDPGLRHFLTTLATSPA
ncbi:Phosphotransferase enzyme family protein [Amycolatopsis arida]|uniref:Phosphotransferase enzyme family protein n=1 Tax=Amycolatopsis arida TaxID=587909 RepID=A0A1I5TX11_9PSEU|nr:phosphotransferase [Amycolatopsis arida]TDX95936.1 phosphotransferase family enzyme [Amycolatopsis arida]SFP87431.1 Phosphotransferase enzyme family protein [Amycolatopsis arida]